MLRGDPAIRVTKKDGNCFERNAAIQEIHRKRIAEAVGVSFHAGRREYAGERSLPVSHRRFR